MTIIKGEIHEAPEEDICEGLEEEEMGEPIYDDEHVPADYGEEMGEPIYDEEPVPADYGESLVARRNLHTTAAKEEPWLQHNIFHTCCTTQDKVCDVINDSGNCENVVSNYMVEKLALPTKEHPHPYKLQWLNKGNEYDRHALYDVHANTYTFVKGEVNTKLAPLPPNESDEGIKESKPLVYLVAKEPLKVTIGDARAMRFIQLLKSNEEVIIPTKMEQLLGEFSDVVPSEIPSEPPPIGDIQNMNYLTPLSSTQKHSANAEHGENEMKKLHEQVCERIVKKISRYKTQQDRHSKLHAFEEGDLKINDNVYKVELPGNNGVSVTFTVVVFHSTLAMKKIKTRGRVSSNPGRMMKNNMEYYGSL